MASSRPVEPVLHCRKDRPKEVYMLSGRLSNGLFAHPDKFPNPKIDKILFEAEREELRILMSAAKGNTKATKLRNAKAVIIHGYIKLLLNFVKPICNGNLKLIQLSGFDMNRQPKKHQYPRKPQILKIVRAGGMYRYKVILEKMQTSEGVDADPATHQRDVRYTVELSLTPDDEKSWNNVCVSVPSNRLFFEDVFPGEKNHIRVYGTNSAGNGPRSNITYFTPQIP